MLEMSMETLWVYHHGSLFPLPMDHFLHIQRLTSKRVLNSIIFINIIKNLIFHLIVEMNLLCQEKFMKIKRILSSRTYTGV